MLVNALFSPASVDISDGLIAILASLLSKIQAAVNMINSMRMKYGTESGPWSGSRVFTHIQRYQFGQTSRILEGMVAKQRVITAQVGSTFVVTCRQTFNIMGSP